MMWMMLLPVHLSCFLEYSEGCEGGQNSGCTPQQETDGCFSLCSHPKVTQYLKPHSSFWQQPRYFLPLSKTMTESVGAQLSPFLFFHSPDTFFSLSYPTWWWLLKGSSLWSLMLAHDKDIYYTDGCYFQRFELQWEKAARENRGRLVLKWKGLILNSHWLYTAVTQLTWMECFSCFIMMSVRRET